jgi:predicted nuclease of restriction endonuclease-like RecB superfamily
MTRLNSANKYHNTRCEQDGIKFDSKAERARNNELLIMKQAGEIYWFNRQPSFVIHDDGTRYRPDFIVGGNDGRVWVEDVKGFVTKEFAEKAKTFREKYPDLELRLIK